MEAGHGSTPLIPEFRTEGQMDLCKFKVSMVYIASSKPGLYSKTLSQSGLGEPVKEAGETEKLKVLAALPKDLSSFPSTHMVAHNLPISNARGLDTCF